MNDYYNIRNGINLSKRFWMVQNCDKNNSNKIVHMCLLYLTAKLFQMQKFKENLALALFSWV